jgi:putative transposase
MRRIKFSINEYYHLYNRGVDRRVIFLDDRDRERFLTLLFLSNSTKPLEITKKSNDPWSFEMSITKDRGEHLVSIGAWVLMPNHFHVLLREKTEGGVSKFMQKVLTGYSSYFNKKYHRSGALFESRFKATHTNDDVYLKYMYAYIHLNPIGIVDKGWKEKKITDFEKAKEFLLTYEYSSLKDFIGAPTSSQKQGRVFGEILDKNAFPGYFETKTKFKEMIDEWMNFEKI